MKTILLTMANQPDRISGVHRWHIEGTRGNLLAYLFSCASRSLETYFNDHVQPYMVLTYFVVLR